MTNTVIAILGVLALIIITTVYAALVLASDADDVMGADQ